MKGVFPHQRILVTGGCGFIGSAVVRTLMRQTEARIAILDKLSYSADPSHLEESLGSERLLIRTIDLLDRAAVAELVAMFRPSLILHLAAETHVDRSIDDPLQFVETNVTGTASLLEAVRIYYRTLEESEKQVFRYVQVSSDEVYGSVEAPGRFSGDSPYRPNSPYSASKAAADHLVRAWWKTYDIPVIFTHSCNNYGPFQYPEKLIPLMIWKGLRGEDFPVYGDGQQTREWLYVEDHARALVLIGHQGIIGEVYHITSGEEIRNIELVQQLVAELRHALGGLSTPLASKIIHVEDRPGHDFRYSMSPGIIKQKLGWQASVSWQEGLARTVRWYLDHPEFFEKKRQEGYKGKRQGSQMDKRLSEDY